MQSLRENTEQPRLAEEERITEEQGLAIVRALTLMIQYAEAAIEEDPLRKFIKYCDLFLEIEKMKEEGETKRIVEEKDRLALKKEQDKIGIDAIIFLRENIKEASVDLETVCPYIHVVECSVNNNTHLHVLEFKASSNEFYDYTLPLFYKSLALLEDAIQEIKWEIHCQRTAIQEESVKSTTFSLIQVFGGKLSSKEKGSVSEKPLAKKCPMDAHTTNDKWVQNIYGRVSDTGHFAHHATHAGAEEKLPPIRHVTGYVTPNKILG